MAGVDKTLKGWYKFIFKQFLRESFSCSEEEQDSQSLSKCKSLDIKAYDFHRGGKIIFGKNDF